MYNAEVFPLFKYFVQLEGKFYNNIINCDTNIFKRMLYACIYVYVFFFLNEITMSTKIVCLKIPIVELIGICFLESSPSLRGLLFFVCFVSVFTVTITIPINIVNNIIAPVMMSARRLNMKNFGPCGWVGELSTFSALSGNKNKYIYTYI